jgi:2-polyprenyl-3-methyl-5-hydroxy-6-metoxy-1,4-benzoquinol methylase
LKLTTKEEIILAYQLMLGREPESEAVVNNLCQTAHSPEQIRNVFIKSPEFVKSMSELVGKPQAVRQRHPYTLPKIPVETTVSEEVLAGMFARIQTQWEHLGQTEPYWSVVTQPQYYQSEFEAHRDEFYISGSYTQQVFVATLKRCGINPASLHTCLEVGCGVGRMTEHLAKVFEQVIATDISGQHLQIAKAHLQTKALHNVELVHWQQTEQLKQLPRVDAILSVITLQHNPPPLLAWLLSQLLDCLNPGGVSFIQIPSYRAGYLFEVERYMNSTPPNTLEMHFLPQQAVFQIIQASGCLCLEVREDGMVGDESNMLSNTYVIQKT